MEAEATSCPPAVQRAAAAHASTPTPTPTPDAAYPSARRRGSRRIPRADSHEPDFSPGHGCRPLRLETSPRFAWATPREGQTEHTPRATPERPAPPTSARTTQRRSGAVAHVGIFIGVRAGEAVTVDTPHPSAGVCIESLPSATGSSRGNEGLPRTGPVSWSRAGAAPQPRSCEEQPARWGPPSSIAPHSGQHRCSQHASSPPSSAAGSGVGTTTGSSVRSW